ncbi:MAG TPA: SOS response-associated peptidase family protein, partial [Acetobacteraceae bacterium]|nr:SOS response-associated peptidase family protein [Acetobacteraceae bacterium]
MATETVQDLLAGADDPAAWELTPSGGRPEALLMAVIRDPETGARTLTRARWGILGRNGARTLFLRSEDAFETAEWERAIRFRRLLLPTDSYVQRASFGHDRGRRFLVSLEDQAPMAVGGVWAEVAGARRFAVLTRRAEDPVLRIHRRMPVIVPPEDWPVWLGQHDLLREGLTILLQRPVAGLQ